MRRKEAIRDSHVRVGVAVMLANMMLRRSTVGRSRLGYGALQCPIWCLSRVDGYPGSVNGGGDILGKVTTHQSRKGPLSSTCDNNDCDGRRNRLSPLMYLGYVCHERVSVVDDATM